MIFIDLKFIFQNQFLSYFKPVGAHFIHFRMSVFKGYHQFFRFFGRRFVHGIHHNGLSNGAQSAGTQFEFNGLIYNVFEHLRLKHQLYLVQLEELDVLFDNRVFRLGEYPAQCIAFKRCEIGQHRQTANYFGYKAE